MTPEQALARARYKASRAPSDPHWGQLDWATRRALIDAAVLAVTTYDVASPPHLNRTSPLAP